MKEYKPEKLIAISRYRKFIPNLSEDIKQDIYARMQELIEEEKKYCDQGNCHIRISSGQKPCVRAETAAILIL